jgi:broad specificity phosphatase PhoE
MARRLVIIRHGEAQSHVDRLVASHNCSGLSPLGRVQADALRLRLARTGELADAVALHTSLMRRAQETAAIIAPAVGDGMLEAQADCGFCEQHHGQADGMAWDDFESRYGKFDRFTERTRAGAPGAESVEQFVTRAGTALRRVADDPDAGAVVLVAHGGIVGSALESILGVRFGSIVRYVENTSINEFVFDESLGRWLLVRLNDAGHLAGLVHS